MSDLWAAVCQMGLYCTEVTSFGWGAVGTASRAGSAGRAGSVRVPAGETENQGHSASLVWESLQTSSGI